MPAHLNKLPPSALKRALIFLSRSRIFKSHPHYDADRLYPLWWTQLWLSRRHLPDMEACGCNFVCLWDCTHDPLHCVSNASCLKKEKKGGRWHSPLLPADPACMLGSLHTGILSRRQWRRAGLEWWISTLSREREQLTGVYTQTLCYTTWVVTPFVPLTATQTLQ